MAHRYYEEFYLSNFYEYMQGLSEPIGRGRMKANWEFWKDIGSSDEVLQVIEQGYKIPLISTPAPVHFKGRL